MNIRWLWFDHFPQGLELPASQRTEIKRLAREHRLKNQNFRGTGRTARWLICLIVIPMAMAFMLWIFALIGLRFRTGVFIVANIGGIVVFQALLWMGITYAMYRTSAPYVRKALCDIGEPVCMECGYSLRGLHEREKCPECGAGREMPETSKTESIP